MSSKYQKVKLVIKPSSLSGQSLHILLFLLKAGQDASPLNDYSAQH